MLNNESDAASEAHCRICFGISYNSRHSVGPDPQIYLACVIKFLTRHQQDATLLMKKHTLIALIILTPTAFAATQCGPFYLKPDSSGWFSVNGERAKTQKVTFLKQKGDYANATVKLQVKNTKAPGMVDMEQTTRDGKGMLRAEIVRTSQSQIRIRGAYDCEQAD